MLMGRKPAYMSGFRPIDMPGARRRDEGGEPETSRRNRLQGAADPGAGAGVGPDFGGDAVLFGFGGVLGFALAAVAFPGRGEDLVGAARAAGGVEGAVVAARLAHHDVGRDRVGAAEPAADFFFGRGVRFFFAFFGFAALPRFGGADLLDVGGPGFDVAFQP